MESKNDDFTSGEIQEIKRRCNLDGEKANGNLDDGLPDGNAIDLLERAHCPLALDRDCVRARIDALRRKVRQWKNGGWSSTIRGGHGGCWGRGDYGDRQGSLWHKDGDGQGSLWHKDGCGCRCGRVLLGARLAGGAET